MNLSFLGENLAKIYWDFKFFLLSILILLATAVAVSLTGTLSINPEMWEDPYMFGLSQTLLATTIAIWTLDLLLIILLIYEIISVKQPL